jgi:Ser/Thr protein kinase RdoA (MazF antagonist)
MEFLHGTTPPRTGLDAEHCRAYGKGVAVIHKAMESFVSEHARFALDFDHLLHEPLPTILARIPHRPDDASFVREAALRLEAQVRELDAQGLTHAICHGDFHGWNAHYDDETKSYTFFDFDCGGPGWLAYDLAVFRAGLHSSQEYEKAEAGWRAFLEGYRSHHELSALNESAVWAFAAIRLIWLMGLHAANAADWGSAFLDEPYYDRLLKLLRAWDGYATKPRPVRETPAPAEVTVRPYEPADEPGLRWLYERTPPAGQPSVRRYEKLAADIEQPLDYYEAVWVSVEPTRDGDAIVGGTMLERVGERVLPGVPTADFIDTARKLGRLHHVSVAPERQRRGIGRRLIDAAVEWARSESYETLVLETTSEQREAIAFYEALGWCEIGRSTFRRWEMVWFELKLSPLPAEARAT